VSNSGTFDISATSSDASVTTLTGSGATVLGNKTLTITNATGDLAGIVSGTGSIVISNGSQTLSGANTYSGGTTIRGGTVKMGDPRALGSGEIFVNPNGTLDLNGLEVSQNLLTLYGGTLTNSSSSTATFSGARINLNISQELSEIDGDLPDTLSVAAGSTLVINSILSRPFDSGDQEVAVLNIGISGNTGTVVFSKDILYFKFEHTLTSRP
jgi:autotransporter-associated beta strand protein